MLPEICAAGVQYGKRLVVGDADDNGDLAPMMDLPEQEPLSCAMARLPIAAIDRQAAVDENVDSSAGLTALQVRYKRASARATATPPIGAVAHQPPPPTNEP